MYLTSLFHRDRLFELTTRWFAGRLEPGDGRLITQIFVYDHLITAPTAWRFVRDLHEPGETLTARRVYSKDVLREAIIDGCLHPTARARQLFSAYHDRPEEFFPRTPTNLLLTSRADGSLAGMARLKSTRRVAEKASRRIADHLSDAIRASARALATQRARARGLSLSQLISSPEVMAEEFATAEKVVSRGFRTGDVVLEPRHVRIDDAIGFKFVGTDGDLASFEAAVRRHPAAVLVEREVHRGEYNAVNLLVDLQLPPVGEVLDRMRDFDWSVAASRGLRPEEWARDLPEYVESGARTFRAEVILTTWDQLVESEFGRTIHEERTIRQRAQAPYSGRIATNASFIIEYLLMLAISPTVEVSSLPVVMWGRYLPDTFSAAVWKLFGIEQATHLVDPFLVAPGEFTGNGAPPDTYRR